MSNRPEYVAIIIGLSKIGVTPALINSNLSALSLVHSINIVKPKAVLYEWCLQESLTHIKNKLDETISMYCIDGEGEGGCVFLLQSLQGVNDASIKPGVSLTPKGKVI